MINALRKISAFLPAFLKDESGQDLVEYGLIVGLIGLACILGLKGITSGVADILNAVGSKLTSSV